MSESGGVLFDRKMRRRRLAGHKLTANRSRDFAWLSVSSGVFTVLLASQPVYAQNLAETTTPIDNSALSPNSPAASSMGSPPGNRQRSPTAPAPPNQPLPGPTFQAGASINIGDSYLTNSAGVSGGKQQDYLSMIGGSAYLHEHSRRLSLDANYSGEVDFYARGTLPTQVNNNLQAVGNLEVIPQHLLLNAQAFAQPIVTSNLGIVTADNRVVPNGYSNSYGYYANPDLRFELGDFASSETLPSFGQIFFTTPPGSLPISLIPGVTGPENTTSRSLTERISSGKYFDRLDWNLVGSFSETDRAQSLLSEKAGITNLRYAVSYKLSLLATVGYDAITNSTPLYQNVSGPVALAGFGLNFGKDFSLELEAGEKYNSPSYFGNLRYNITPTASLTASLNDYVQTPEGQLLSNLTNLTARPDGSLGAVQDVLGNGSPASLSSFNLQSQGNLGLDQNISRYQTANISFAEDFERNHASITAFGTRRTILSGVFIGPPTVTSYGTQALFSRDLSPLLRGSVGGSYSIDNELGGDAGTWQAQTGLTYQLSRQTSIYGNLLYLNRSSSAFLQALSPFTGSLTEFRATIGVSHAL